jgi:hypothetical protein
MAHADVKQFLYLSHDLTLMALEIGVNVFLCETPPAGMGSNKARNSTYYSIA